MDRTHCFTSKPELFHMIALDKPGYSARHPLSWLSHYLFLSYVGTITYMCTHAYTHTDTQQGMYTHWCLFYLGKMMSNWRASVFYHLIHFIELRFCMHHWLNPESSGAHPESWFSIWQGRAVEQPKAFSVAFVVDFENKQMCIDIKQSKNSVQAYWLFHT